MPESKSTALLLLPLEVKQHPAAALLFGINSITEAAQAIDKLVSRAGTLFKDEAPTEQETNKVDNNNNCESTQTNGLDNNTLDNERSHIIVHGINTQAIKCTLYNLNAFACTLDTAIVTNQLVTFSSGPNTVSPEPSPAYDHLPDRCLATRTQCAPAQALVDHSLHPLIHRALSARPNIASAPALIQRCPRNLPQPSAGAPLCSASSGFLHHVGSIAAISLAMTPVQLVLTPVQLMDSLGLTPLVSLEL
jgi:hypothetical protein